MNQHRISDVLPDVGSQALRDIIELTGDSNHSQHHAFSPTLPQRPSPTLSLDGLEMNGSSHVFSTETTSRTPDPSPRTRPSGDPFRIPGSFSSGTNGGISSGSPEPGIIGHHVPRGPSLYSPFGASPTGTVMSPILSQSSSGGNMNNVVTEISSNLRRLADMIEKGGYQGLGLPQSPANTPSPSHGRSAISDLLGPMTGLNLSVDPIVLQNLQMLAQVAQASPPNGSEPRPAPTIPSIATPTPPGSSNPTPTPPAGFPQRQGKVNIMQIRCKFGQLGSGKTQFSSPHGFCMGLDEEIVIADTNNHRICIYDKSGEFRSSFGVAGKDEGQLWYPRKVCKAFFYRQSLIRCRSGGFYPKFVSGKYSSHSTVRHLRQG